MDLRKEQQGVVIDQVMESLEGNEKSPGPILPERRSKRNSQDVASMLFLSFTSAYKKASKVSPGVISYK